MFQGDCQKPVLLENIRCLKRESALAQLRSLIQDTPEIGLDSIVHIVQNLSPAQRAEVAKTIGRLESSPATVPASAGTTPAPLCSICVYATFTSLYVFFSLPKTNIKC